MPSVISYYLKEIVCPVLSATALSTADSKNRDNGVSGAVVCCRVDCCLVECANEIARSRLSRANWRCKSCYRYSYGPHHPHDTPVYIHGLVGKYIT